MIDLVIVGAAAVLFLAPLLIGYRGYGSPRQPRPWLKKALIGLVGLQLVVLAAGAWIFVAENLRQVNHWKWILPLLSVDLLMWACVGLGFAAAAWRCRFRTGADR